MILLSKFRLVFRDDTLLEFRRQLSETLRGKHGHMPRHLFVFDESRKLDPAAELGAYAHLMKCIAFHLMDRRGTSEVELVRTGTPEAPLLHRSLPDLVLRAQGLR